MDFLTKAIVKFIGNTLLGFVASITNLTREIFESSTKEFLEYSTIQRIHNFFLGISIFLIIFFAIKRYFDVYIMETGGDPDADPVDILVNATKAIAISISSSWIFATFINFTISIAKNVAEIIKSQDKFGATISSSIKAIMKNGMAGGATWMWYMLGLVIGITIFFIIGFMRAIDLMLMYIITPFFCVDLVNTKHERFDGFLTNLIVTALYYILQLICFSMFTQSMLGVLTGFTPDNGIGASGLKVLAWLIAAIKSPKWLDKFVYSTGLGDKVNRGVSSVGTSVVRSLVSSGLKGK